MLKSDVVIVSNRPWMLKDAVGQAKRLIAYNSVIVVDTCTNPDERLLEELGVKFLLVPDATLGYARQRGLQTAKTEYVVFVDDDITLTEGWYSKLLNTIENSDENVLAVNSKIVYGIGTNSIIQKLHMRANRDAGGSIGISILKREQVLALGGFNVAVHRGEDTELEMRLRQHGKRWVCQREAVAYHPCTFKHYLERARNDGFGYIVMWQSINFRLRFIVERFVAVLVMSIYYGLLCLDLRVFGVYFLAKFTMLWTFLRNV